MRGLLTPLYLSRIPAGVVNHRKDAGEAVQVRLDFLSTTPWQDRAQRPDLAVAEPTGGRHRHGGCEGGRVVLGVGRSVEVAPTALAREEDGAERWLRVAPAKLPLNQVPWLGVCIYGNEARQWRHQPPPSAHEHARAHTRTQAHTGAGTHRPSWSVRSPFAATPSRTWKRIWLLPALTRSPTTSAPSLVIPIT